jgi:protein arginine kinase activator
MLCQKCLKNLATVRYAEVVDGQVTDLHLCAECLDRHQRDAASGFELTAPAPTPRKGAGDRMGLDEFKGQFPCPHCGAKLTHIMETGKVGCCECFHHFGSQIESILEGLHRSLRHKGKVARLDDARARLRTEMQTKRALLRSVLRAENYEEAARLRDEIRTLEQGLRVSDLD